MRSLFYFLFVSSLSLMISCTSTGEQGQEEQTTAPDSIIITTENENSPNNPAFGVVDDENRFPYLKVVDDTTTRMQAYTVDMKVTHSFPLGPVTSEKLYWIDETSSDENIGIFLH